MSKTINENMTELCEKLFHEECTNHNCKCDCHTLWDALEFYGFGVVIPNGCKTKVTDGLSKENES